MCVLQTRSFLPFSYNDPGFFVRDIGDAVSESLTVHLWDTESFKHGWIPCDPGYFEANPGSSFTRIFRKYLD